MLTNEDLDRIESEVDKHVKLWPEEVRKLVKMARRYAWLREGADKDRDYLSGKLPWVTRIHFKHGTPSQSPISGIDMDYLIDQAIAGERDAK
jgi:hypothetical protein